jgi:hypothetical protein
MKEQYIRMRNSHKIDVDVLYTYAVSKGFTLSIEEFLIGLHLCNINDIITQLDIEFGLTKIYDSEDNFIMVM